MANQTLSRPAAPDKSPAVLVPFTKAAHEHTEGAFQDVTTSSAAFSAGSTQLSPADVPAYGYLRDIFIEVTLAAGVNGTVTVAANRDAPWNVINSVSLTDVNGGIIVGPFSGYDLMLVNKWGGYSHQCDPLLQPDYSAISVGASGTGNATFILRLPVEIMQRDALGALPNMNSSSTYKLNITLAGKSTVFATAPGTPPTVRIRSFLNAWAPPAATDIFGNAQETSPKGVGTTQYWTKTSHSISTGDQTPRLQRVGNHLRNLIFVLRDSSGVRDGSSFPDPFQLRLDGLIVHSEAVGLRRRFMAERYGVQLAAIGTADFDEGVVVVDFTHDFDGHPGGELADLWLRTTQATRLELNGTFGAAGSLDVITNDVAPVGMVK